MALAAGAVFTAFAGVDSQRCLHGRTLQVVDDLVLTSVALAGGDQHGAGRPRRPRAAAGLRTALALGFVAFAAGEMIWTGYELTGHETPFPSPADAAFLLFPVGACVGLLLYLPNAMPAPAGGC